MSIQVRIGDVRHGTHFPQPQQFRIDSSRRSCGADVNGIGAPPKGEEKSKRPPEAKPERETVEVTEDKKAQKTS
jgi:hypothetical protein